MEIVEKEEKVYRFEKDVVVDAVEGKAKRIYDIILPRPLTIEKLMK